ncbi:hypothetical protein ABT282_07060 [Streptomyces sp. NPDC000927]|uniref:hypothetical protein n=1 Tax=Streptomyces sp. NPDC000927 TaxID=3154371 RepID=UPI0033188990
MTASSKTRKRDGREMASDMKRADIEARRLLAQNPTQLVSLYGFPTERAVIHQMDAFNSGAFPEWPSDLYYAVYKHFPDRPEGRRWVILVGLLEFIGSLSPEWRDFIRNGEIGRQLP